jgi:hypothetical protein
MRRINRLPLNQSAKRALEILKVSPHGLDLYLLQLVQWCLDTGRVSLTQRRTMRAYLDAFDT